MAPPSLQPTMEADGSFSAMIPIGGSVEVFAIQDGGMIFAGGGFDRWKSGNGFVDTSGYVLLDTDGSRAFAQGPYGGGGPAAAVVGLGGKFIIGGFFSSISGSPRQRLARLNSNGALDNSFDPGQGPNGDVLATAEQLRPGGWHSRA